MIALPEVAPEVDGETTVTLLRKRSSKSTSMKFLYELVKLMFSMWRRPEVEPGTLMTAPSVAVPAVLQLVTVPSMRTATVFSAKSKHDPVTPLTVKSVIETDVPCPLPWVKTEPTFSKVTSLMVKFPVLQSAVAEPHEGPVPSWRLPERKTESVVSLKLTFLNTWRSSVPPAVVHSLVNAIPSQSAPFIPVKLIGAVALPLAKNLVHPPSKEIPLPAAI